MQYFLSTQYSRAGTPQVATHKCTEERGFNACNGNLSTAIEIFFYI